MTSEGSQGHNCGAWETKLHRSQLTQLWAVEGSGKCGILVCLWYCLLDKLLLGELIIHSVVHIEFMGINVI